MAGANMRQHAMLVRIARNEYNAHVSGHSAKNGWARFYSDRDAQLFADLAANVDDSMGVTVFSQGKQIAVDWSIGARYRNDNLADRIS